MKNAIVNKELQSLVLILLFSVSLFAQVPRIMNYQGKLTSYSGIGVNDTLPIVFLIYDTSSGGSPLWIDTVEAVIDKGLFSVQLDLSVNGGDTLRFDRPYWMEIVVDGSTLHPREKLAPVSFSFRSIYADTAEFVIGGADGDYIQNQDTVAQDANEWITGKVSGGILRAVPNTPDTFTVQAGMIRTLSSGSGIETYIYDGTCWRKWFPVIDTVGCYGGSLSVDAGPDTAICSGNSVELTATVSGGWPPYDYDWDNDGTGDWDDPQSIFVSPTDTAVYNVQVRDAIDSTASDAVVVNVADCLPFARAVGGTNYDYGYHVVQTSDGGYAVAGMTQSFSAGDFDFFLVKFNLWGNVQWARSIGGFGGERGYSVVQASDGGYVIAGYSGSFGPVLHDLFLVKFSSSGAFEWVKTVGGTDYDEGWSVVQTSDSGYAVVGYTGSFGAGGDDLFLVKFNSSGSFEWARTVGGTNDDWGYSVIQTLDNGYAVAGYTYSFGAGDRDLFLVKFNSFGLVEWARAVGGTSDDWGFSVAQTNDGGYAVVGGTQSFGAGGWDLFLVKFSSLGALEWAKAVGGTGDDYCRSVVQTSDGGYAVAGMTQSFGAGSADLFLVKFSSSGAFEWAKAVGGTDYDEGWSLALTSDGEYAVAGWTTSFGAGNEDLFLVKFDADGNSCIGSSVIPDTNTPSPTVTDVSRPTVNSPSPTINSPSPTVNSPSPTETNCCP